MPADRPQDRGFARSYLILLLAAILSMFAFASHALAGTVNLAWDPVAGASGYRVSYGTVSRTYTATVDTGGSTTTTIANLTDGARYYFAVQAYAGAVTSDYSNEVSTVIQPLPTPPVASFTANGSTAASISVLPGQTVNFVDTSTGTVSSRLWNLGDGTTSSAATVVKSYPTVGTRTVKLSVTGAGVTRSASKTVNVTAAPPVANFSATPTAGTAPLTVNFTDSSSGSITGWSWSFGNGATSTARNPTVTYSGAGTYTVSLTVTGPGGSNTATKTDHVTVTTASAGGGATTVGLVAAYGFDEASGTQVLDSSGRGNHGTLSNATRTSTAKFGRALSFNGTNSLVTVADSRSLDLTNGVTLSAWVYPTTWATGWKSLLMKERAGGLAYALYANSDTEKPNGTLRIASAPRRVTAGNHLPNNTWTHLATTYDGATQRLYINGAPVGSRAQIGAIETSASPLRIGGNTVWAGQYFQGLIDEVRVYNRALSQTEIAAVTQTVSACVTPCSLWDNTTTPAIAAKADPTAVEVGVKFRSTVKGVITGVRFYKGVGNTGTHVGRLWSATGELLAQATFTNETASGWQQVNFAAPVPIKANTTYVVSYYAPAGRYAYNEDYFNSAYSNGPLRALSNTEAGGNGVYRYGNGGVFPTNTYETANYWVDPVFRTP